MPKTRINCPNCRQPVTAEIDQLFDVYEDPAAKQKFLSGAFNRIDCPTCHYQGAVASPLVYHDPEKELLLTFVPPEMNLPRNDQERLLGQIINQVVNRLPQEKRKGYLLRPQANLTLQSMIETVLEADGITREMIQAQQQRLNLLQRLISTPAESLPEVAKSDDALIDADFFGLLRRMAEASIMAGDQQSAQALAALQDALLPLTTFGQELQARSQEVELAMADLQKLGRGLTRESLLDLVAAAPSDTRLRALVSLARPVMDYAFFQVLSDRIAAASGDDQQSLETLRDSLLEMTRQVDEQNAARTQEARDTLEAILSADDIPQAAMQGLGAIDEFFVNEVNSAVEAARQASDSVRLGKLQQLIQVLQQASGPPPEFELIEAMLDLPDDAARAQFLQEHDAQVTPEFIDALTSILTQVQSGEDPDLAERVKAIHQAVLRYSMTRNMKG
jgi:hypothetical protein